MFEQTTAREALAVAREWGPLWVTIVGFVIFKIVEKWKFRKRRSQFNESDKKRDIEIEKLRAGKGKILSDISVLRVEHQKEISKAISKSASIQISYEKQFADFRVELERRTTFDWMEEKVLPRIDALTGTVSTLAAVVDRDQSNVKALTESIPRLTNAIEKMNEKDANK